MNRKEVNSRNTVNIIGNSKGDIWSWIMHSDTLILFCKYKDVQEKKIRQKNEEIT